MSDTYITFEINEDKRLRIVHEYDNAEDPRNWDNLGTMVCWHSRYRLGDDHDLNSPDDFNMSSEDYAIVLPLYLYDHSGITISTQPFSCRWDSGQIGWIYVTKAKLREDYGVKRITAKVLEQAEACLLAEVETYDLFIRGEVYGFILEERENCQDCGHDEWNHADSCFGFYGDDWENNGLLGHLDKDVADAIRSNL